MKDYDKIRLQRKIKKLANMITEMKAAREPLKVNFKMDTKLNQGESSMQVPDHDEIREVIQQEAYLFRKNKTFEGQKEVFMKCVQYISNLALS